MPRPPSFQIFFCDGLVSPNRGFGTFGVRVGYDLSDGGRKHSAAAVHKLQLVQGQNSLPRVAKEIELLVRTAWNKLECTRQMVKVSEELLKLCSESRRFTARQLREASALRSLADSAARKLELWGKHPSDGCLSGCRESPQIHD